MYKCSTCGKTYSDLDHYRFDGLCPHCFVGGGKKIRKKKK